MLDTLCCMFFLVIMLVEISSPMHWNELAWTIDEGLHSASTGNTPPPPFFSPPNSHSIFDLSLPVFKGNQQNIFQIYAWNNTSKFSWKPRTMDSNEFLIILNFTVFLPSLLTTVGPQVINYLSLSFESYIFFFLLFISSALFSYQFI